MRREALKFWDLVRLILETLRYMVMICMEESRVKYSLHTSDSRFPFRHMPKVVMMPTLSHILVYIGPKYNETLVHMVTAIHQFLLDTTIPYGQHCIMPSHSCMLLVYKVCRYAKQLMIHIYKNTLPVMISFITYGIFPLHNMLFHTSSQ